MGNYNKCSGMRIVQQGMGKVGTRANWRTFTCIKRVINLQIKPTDMRRRCIPKIFIFSDFFKRN